VPVTLPEEGLYLPRPDTLWFITTIEADRQKDYLRSKLRNQYFDTDPGVRAVLLDRLRVVLYERYVKATLADGTAVGSIAGQSLGEKVTQETLNVHKAPGIAAARQAAASLSRAVYLYNVSAPKVPSSSIYFREPQTYDTLKRLSYELRSVLVSNVLRTRFPIIIERAHADAPEVLEDLDGLGIDWHERFDRAFPPSSERSFEPPDWVLRLELDPDLLFAYRVTPKVVAEAIERGMTANVRCVYTPLGGLPVRDADGAPAARSLPVVDVLIALGSKAKPKGRPKGRGAAATASAPGESEPAESGTRSFADEQSYQLRVAFAVISKLRVCGVAGISQLHPYFMPIVRFFSLTTLREGEHELRFDTSLMRYEGVRPSQIEAYVRQRLGMLLPDASAAQMTAMVRPARDKILLAGVSRQHAEAVKNYSAVEPLTTFATLESDSPSPDVPGERVVTLVFHQQVLESFGFSPPSSALAKIMSLVVRELQLAPRRTLVRDAGRVAFTVDATAYEKLVKPPSLFTFVSVTTDEISDLTKEEHTLELLVLPEFARHELSLRRVIEVAVRESGALFGVRQRRAAASYSLVLTLGKEAYDRFIRGYDAVQNARAEPRLPGDEPAHVWETEILIDVSTIVPTYNQWSYQTIGSNLRDVLSLPQVNTKCTTSDDPNEIFDLFGIEATAAYLVTELNRNSNQKRDIDPRHIGLVVDAMCSRAVPHSVSRHGLAEEGSEGMTKAAMEQASRTFLNNALTGSASNGQGPAERLLLGMKATIGTQVATDRMEAVLTGHATSAGGDTGGSAGQEPTAVVPPRSASRAVALRPGAERRLLPRGRGAAAASASSSSSGATALTPAIKSLTLG
jgi:RNA polymerase Rpb1, domain 5